MEKVKIANLTPHPINLQVEDKVVEIKPTGYVLRVKEVVKELGIYKGIRIVKKALDDKEITYGDVEMLRDLIKKYDIIVVSLIAGKLVKKMYEMGLLDDEEVKKFFVVGNVVRDEQGRVLFADALAPVYSL